MSLIDDPFKPNRLCLIGKKCSAYILSLYLKIKNSTPIFPVVLFDSGIIVLIVLSLFAISKHSSKVLQEIV